MKKVTLFAALMAISLFASSAMAGNGKGPVGPPGGLIWADGMAYKTVGTPTTLPGHGPKDGLYVFDNLMGQHAVSESKPGDMDYNGGRWQVYVLAFTEEGLAVHDADDDGMADFELTSWEDVQTHIGLGHIEQLAMGPSLECPLIR
jgi:hypothetical protein